MINDNKSLNDCHIDDDLEFFKEQKKFMNHAVNGFTRFLILWIIFDNESIHGYGVMKELDGFFEYGIEQGIIKKSSSSKIYPILNKMEEAGLIVGSWETQDNKQVKFYKITEKGKFFINHIKSKRKTLRENPIWMKFSDYFHDRE